MVDPFRLSRQLARVELRRCMFAATCGPTASQSVVGVHVRPVQPVRGWWEMAGGHSSQRCTAAVTDRVGGTLGDRLPPCPPTSVDGRPPKRPPIQ